MSFKGSYTYATAKALDATLAETSELLDDPDMPSPFDGEIERKGLTLRIEIDTSCPSDWYFTYEAIIETLAQAAKSGSVEATCEGESETIEAGPDEDDDE